MSLFSVCRYLSTTSPKITNPIFPKQLSPSSSAHIYWAHLQTNVPNIERTLDKVNVKLDPLSLISVLQTCVDFNQPLLGLRFFIWAGLQPSYGHSLCMYNKACNLLRIDRNPGIIYDVIHAYGNERCFVGVKTFKVVLCLCKEARLGNEGLWVLRKMKEFGCKVNTVAYNIVIRSFCYMGNVDEAVRLVREMGLTGNFPDMITYGAVVKFFVDGGRLNEAFGLFRDMRAHGCVPNTVLYSILIDGVCRFGSFEKALELLCEMENGGKSCRPNAVTYTTVIQSLCEGGRSVMALNVLDRMKTFGCSPNRITLRTLINGLCVEDNVEEAYKLIERVVEVGDLSVGECYSSLVVSLLWVGKFEEAEKVFRILLAGGVNPEGLASSHLIRGFCLKGRVLDGFRLYNDIKILGNVSSIDSDIYSLLLAGLIENSYMVEAENLAGQMMERDIQLRPPYREDVVDFLINSGKIALLSHFFRGQNR
ncbi:Pentatricopeptide repeat-containing protein [Heracleum sosnowskyi]|uniref:Pentatricopeptide repeat-containing protein n=1 Tax=Heracleum sosnowskyi TaxID=360622 RepID=A0AAD8N1L9_9APIA|nr:Pentatricopeptide repeat-containing protein [Heracleum sosnowskyi]